MINTIKSYDEDEGEEFVYVLSGKIEVAVCQEPPYVVAPVAANFVSETDKDQQQDGDDDQWGRLLPGIVCPSYQDGRHGQYQEYQPIACHGTVRIPIDIAKPGISKHLNVGTDSCHELPISMLRDCGLR